jgi:hypothetical protein
MKAERNSDVDGQTTLDRVAALLAAEAGVASAWPLSADDLDALTGAIRARSWWWVPLVARVGSWNQRRW